MGESLEQLVQMVQYPKDTIATFGYQMITIVGNKFRDGLASNRNLPTKESHQQHQPLLSKTKLWLHHHNNNDSSGPVSSSLDDADDQPSTVIELPEYTLEDVSYHDTPFDCWVVIYDRVYDITSFLHEHKGGDEVMLDYAGRDATLAFRSVGHSKIAEQSLKTYLVGVLIEEERIWTNFFNRIVADKPS